jgi:hypothetical protein
MTRAGRGEAFRESVAAEIADRVRQMKRLDAMITRGEDSRVEYSNA